jgi:hypothetical protein
MLKHLYLATVQGVPHSCLALLLMCVHECLIFVFLFDLPISVLCSHNKFRFKRFTILYYLLQII